MVKLFGMRKQQEMYHKIPELDKLHFSSDDFAVVLSCMCLYFSQEIVGLLMSIFLFLFPLPPSFHLQLAILPLFSGFSFVTFRKLYEAIQSCHKHSHAVGISIRYI